MQVVVTLPQRTKQTGENTMRNYTVIQMTTGRAYKRKPRVIKHNGQF